jgi:hypothetical protein
MGSTDKGQSFGVKALWISGSDGIEEQIKALQDCNLAIKISNAELRGDDSLDPMAIAPNKRDMTVTGKGGMISMKAMQLAQGGSLVNISTGNTVTAPLQESEDSSITSALTAAGGSGSMVTDTWLFTALSPTTYQVEKGSDGTVYGPFTTGPTPDTSTIPGVSFTVAATPALVVGAMATIMTTSPTGLIDHLTLTKTDMPGICRVRILTEYQQGFGQFEFTLFKTQALGNTFPIKHKEFSITDFEFKMLWNDVMNRTYRIKRLK